MNPIARHIARKALKRAAAEHIARHPQLACYAFDLITLFILLDGQYEKDELELLSRLVFPRLPAGGTCLDVGANIGNHSVHFARHFARVISLEPHPRNFALLAINATLADNIRPLALGASDRAQTVEIVEDRMNLAASSMHRTKGRDGRTVPFRLERIDDMPEVQAAGPITFMKLDVEGHEAAAIAGAAGTIRKHRPVIMLEILAEDIADGSSASIEALRGLGYGHFHVPVEGGLISRAPHRLKKPLRSLKAVATGRRVSKAERLVPVVRLEPRNYLMVLCAADPPAYAG